MSDSSSDSGSRPNQSDSSSDSGSRPNQSDEGQDGYGEHRWGEGAEGEGGEPSQPQWGQPGQGQQGPRPGAQQWGQQPWQGADQPQPPGHYAGGPQVPQEDHPKTILAFVLSLVGIVICQPVAIGGLVVGRQVKKDMRAQPGRYRNEGLATAAVVIGWIAVGLMALGILFIVLFFVIFSTATFTTDFGDLGLALVA